MTVGIVGLGLIGGSMAKALKAHTRHRVLGMDIAESAMLKAEMMDSIDGRLTDELLPECDVVLVALYPRDIVAYVTERADRFGPGCLVVDIGGVKRAVTEPLAAVAAGRPWTFIGGHPMAGREFSGFTYAKDDLFDNASMILSPYPDTPIEKIKRAKDFFLEMGFRMVKFATPEAHDEMIAYTSQLAHIVSSAYVRSPLSERHKGFSAGSFQDMTRVARLNERMWAELFIDNRALLLTELQALIDRLGEYRDRLLEDDFEGLKGLLRDGRLAKEKLDEP
ncbi:MAG: prephenate dehydrogenase [Clostridiales bacterium]|nr:prephenate dehydrogenase [Clostridiales bacterium]